MRGLRRGTVRKATHRAVGRFLRELPLDGLAVERVDVVGEVLQDDAALYLQRRRQVTVVLGEVDGQDAEPAHRLRLADGPVRVVDRPLDLAPDALVLRR